MNEQHKMFNDKLKYIKTNIREKDVTSANEWLSDHCPGYRAKIINATGETQIVETSSGKIVMTL